MIKMWLTTALQITLISQAACKYTWGPSPLRYVDYKIAQDLYFDRIVPLTFNANGAGKNLVNYGIGVLISSDRILTSYNPFRKILKDKANLGDSYTTTLYARTRYKTGRWLYTMSESRFACARQVQYLPDDVISKDDLWHGMGKRNCPLHDLSVFRIYNNLTISTLATKEYTMEQFPYGRFTKAITKGVFITVLAKPHDQLGAEFKMCSIRFAYVLWVTEYEGDDNAVVDCDDWMPREWGHFICILNKNKYKSVSSGAILVSDEKLFGVASFVLFRGAESIIVFTDIIPYYTLIYNTCTYSDSRDRRPKSFS